MDDNITSTTNLPSSHGTKNSTKSDDIYTDNTECVICEVKFINNVESKIHSMIHSEDHKCFVCNQFVKNRFQFVGHVRKHMGTKPFRCPEKDCDKTFANARETKLHQKVHSDDRPYMCTECGKAFKLISTLRDHEVVHTGEKRFKCKICEGAFATATSLRRHIRVMHEAVRTFICHFCNATFTSKQALVQHTSIHRDEDPLKCRLCNVKLPDEITFADHQNKHVELKQSGNCDYCANKTFYFGLKEHIAKMHHPRTCPTCDLVFYDDKSMENHRKSHLKLPETDDLTCKQCGKRFEFPRYLKAHAKRHQDDYKKFKCGLCSKAFSSKRDLNDHLMVHANVKNHRCEVCGKAFRTKRSVNKHMPIHSDKRPFHCNLCPKQFKKQSILRKHLMSHSKSRPFRCTACGKSYKWKESLRVHQLTHTNGKRQTYKNKRLKYKAHECDEKTFKSWKKWCVICERYVKSAKSFALHCRVHFGGFRFKCDVCHFRFRRECSLKLHKLRFKREGFCKIHGSDFVEVKNECDSEDEGDLSCVKIECIEIKNEVM